MGGLKEVGKNWAIVRGLDFILRAVETIWRGGEEALWFG